MIRHFALAEHSIVWYHGFLSMYMLYFALFIDPKVDMRHLLLLNKKVTTHFLQVRFFSTNCSILRALQSQATLG